MANSAQALLADESSSDDEADWSTQFCWGGPWLQYLCTLRKEDIDAMKSVKELKKIKHLLRQATAEYSYGQSLKNKRKIKSSEESKEKEELVAFWQAFVQAFAEKKTYDPEFKDLERRQIDQTTLEQRHLGKRVSERLEQVSGVSHTDRIIEEVGLLPYDASKSFDSTEADSCKLEQCPFPYGPTVDDEGHVVIHHLFWASRPLIDPSRWSESEYALVKDRGLGGFVGEWTLPGQERGYTGNHGAAEIEKAIEHALADSSWINKGKQCRAAWYINAPAHQSIQTLPHAHVWLVRL